MPNLAVTRSVAAALGWLLLAGIVFATLGPQHLRPHVGDPQLERFGAYFITAAVFAFAYPRRPYAIALISVAVAIFLEVGQLFVPGRDAHVRDAAAKALGGVSGAIALGILPGVFRRRGDVEAP